MKYGMHKCQSQHSHDDDEDHRQHKSVCERILCALPIICTELLAGEHGKARSHPIACAHDHKKDRTRGAYRCKSIAAYESSDYDGIYHIVELLKDVPEQKRDHESKHEGQRTSRGHICFHIYLRVR